MKKIISVIVSTAITLSTAACVSAETYAPKLNVENNKITVTNAVENGTLILAFYNGETLVGANMYDTEADITAAPENADRLKAFYWDMESITPLGENVIDRPISDTPTEDNNIMVQIGDKNFAATLYENETAAAFKALLPLTLDMCELNSNEKYFYMSDNLPDNAERVGTINEGDIMLYGTNCIVLFYETFNTIYSYTRIGHIDDVTGLKESLGSGDVTVAFK